jgi:hypothetical protein
VCAAVCLWINGKVAANYGGLESIFWNTSRNDGSFWSRFSTFHGYFHTRDESDRTPGKGKNRKII